MANPEHLQILQQGGVAWNAWRSQQGGVRPDLSGANLNEAALHRADLRRASLTGADLSEAALGGAALTDANLSYVRLFETVFSDIDLTAVRGERGTTGSINMGLRRRGCKRSCRSPHHAL
jgi:hypothetical protein